MAKQLRIGLFLAGTGHHVASWRHPRAQADGAMNLSYLKNIAKKAEQGKLDMLFLADSLSVNAKSHPNILSRFEPFTLLAILAAETEKIGLAATGSTTYSVRLADIAVQISIRQGSSYNITFAYMK